MGEPASVPVLLEESQRTRRLTLALVDDLDERQKWGEPLPDLNPPIWEAGHVAWFHEYWVLRFQGDSRDPAPSIVADADRLYDSSAVPRAARWRLPLLSWDETVRYLDAVSEAVASVLLRRPDDARRRYFAQYALYHEQMHVESLWYTRQRLGYPAPRLGVLPPPPPEATVPKDAEIAGGPFMLGASPSAPFAFDNEKWAHPVDLPPFGIARTLVTNAEFAAFVDDGGYRDPRWWSPEGWAWRQAEGAEHPLYWIQDGPHSWAVRWFDQVLPLHPTEPVVHVNWYEADAYCRWAGRRLPTEAEWERAACADAVPGAKRAFPWGDTAPAPGLACLEAWYGRPVDVRALAAGDSRDGVRQLTGNVWEWCADWFRPYPGFVPDPYRDYSEPWFGTHRVLRGGSWVTPAFLLRNTWRNYYRPERREVVAGFRTCRRDV